MAHPWKFIFFVWKFRLLLSKTSYPTIWTRSNEVLSVLDFNWWVSEGLWIYNQRLIITTSRNYTLSIWNQLSKSLNALKNYTTKESDLSLQIDWCLKRDDIKVSYIFDYWCFWNNHKARCHKERKIGSKNHYKSYSLKPFVWWRTHFFIFFRWWFQITLDFLE